jgi:hypothetical protein
MFDDRGKEIVKEFEIVEEAIEMEASEIFFKKKLKNKIKLK